MNSVFLAGLQRPRNQFFAVLFTAIYIGALLVMQYNKNIYQEPILTLEQPSGRAKSIANEIEIGMFINSFPTFSFKDTKFVMDAILWFKFEQGTESLATIEQFQIKNSLAKANHDVVFKSPPIIKLMGDKVLVAYHIQSTFLTEVKFFKFPISDHRLNFFIENKSVTGNEMLFVTKPENFGVAEEYLVDDWEPRGFHVQSGIVTAQLSSSKEKAMTIGYPSVAISLDFENVGARSLISLYFPLFILFFIGLLSMAIGIFDPARLAVIAASFPTLVLFRLVVDAVSPVVGYPTHIDYIYYILVGLSFVVLIFQTYVMLMGETLKEEKDSTRHDTIKRRLELWNVLLFYLVLISLSAILLHDFFH